MTNRTKRRLCRGGGWLFHPQSAQVADRYFITPVYRDDLLGVRLVEVIEEVNV
jgi:formylglycine-generating enzyme required for sulfatase activity